MKVLHRNIQNERNEVLLEVKTTDLINAMGLNLTHNHPHPYREDMLGTMSNTATCLSEGEINTLKSWKFRWKGETYPMLKSITADCSNGSRMTLLRKTDNITDETAFDKARNNLQRSYVNYVNESKDVVSEGLINYAEIYKSQNNGQLPSAEILRVEKMRLQKEYAEKHYYDYIKDNIAEFDSLGFELSMEWIA